MNTKRKTLYIQLAGILLCLVCAVIGILWHYSLIKEDTTQESKNPQNVIDKNTQSNNDGTGYDPFADLESVNIPEKTPQYSYDYYTEAKNYNTATYLSSLGYRLTEMSYEGENTKLGVISSNFDNVFSSSKRKTNKVLVKESQKGGYTTYYEETDEACPLLVPYYGYIIYTSKNEVKLLDAKGNTLMGNFWGYTPAYATDHAGNPLFIKDDKYYFYYDGRSYDGAAYSKIENDDYTDMGIAKASAYQYFAYDRDCLLNLFATNDFENQSNMTGIAYLLPQKAGMVEYKADPITQIDLQLPGQCYNREEGKLFRFPAYTYKKVEKEKVNEKPTYTIEVEEVLWGYMDKNGDVVIEPKYKRAYNFQNGYAVVEDVHGHLCIINEWGTVVHNAFGDDNLLYIPELGNQKVRDGHYLPDTFGLESSGMLAFDSGYIRMRRKLVDTEHGYITKWEYSVLCDPEGNTLNLPAGCELVGYSDGIMLLKKGEKFGYMKTNGDWLVEPLLSYAQPFSEGLAVMGYEKGKLGVIDTEGNTLLYHMYDHIENCSGGIITAYSSVGGWSIFHKMSTLDTPDITNPIIALKERAIAEAKYEFYVFDKEKETEDELQSGEG